MSSRPPSNNAAWRRLVQNTGSIGRTAPAPQWVTPTTISAILVGVVVFAGVFGALVWTLTLPTRPVTLVLVALVIASTTVTVIHTIRDQAAHDPRTSPKDVNWWVVAGMGGVIVAMATALSILAAQGDDTPTQWRRCYESVATAGDKAGHPLVATRPGHQMVASAPHCDHHENGPRQ